MLGREVHTNFCAVLVWEMQEPQKKTASVKKCSDYANAFLWNYSFGLTMPGRSSNTANPNDTYKFTSHELDDEAGLNIYHVNARGMDPVLGRMMQIDSRHEKYPGISPYAYVLNSPVNFTDMTGDTVDISEVQKVYDNAVYGKGHERAGERKDFSDMTAQEQQAHHFMDYYNNGGAEELAAFDIGGEFETTNITFSFATETPAKSTWFGLKYGSHNVAGFGLTTFGVRGEPVSGYDPGKNESTTRTSLDNINFNVYLNPERSRGLGDRNTSRHEMGHVKYISGQFLKGIGTVIRNGIVQHGDHHIIPKPPIPSIQQLIKMSQ